MSGKATPNPLTFDELLERELAVILERDLELLADDWYHPRDSRGSREGWPDYAIVVGPWLLLAELKRNGGSPTAAQAAWLRRLVGPGRVSLLVGGLEGVAELVRVVEGTRKGRLRAAPTRVVVLGSISPAGRRAVGADVLPGDAAPAADAPTVPPRPSRRTRRRPRGS